jgi:8-oxo-dGTP diphosphatase
MSESEFLESYDPADYERPSVAVDLVLMTIVEGQLAVLLQQREDHPFKDYWALPGGFVGMSEDLDEAACRIRKAKAHLDSGYLEQLYSFGRVDRDPRTRVITVAYMSLMPMPHFLPAFKQGNDLILAEINVPWEGEAGGPVTACSEDGTELPFAFDHADIIGQAVRRLRGKLDYTPIGFALLDEAFTLRELQDVHEAILGTRFHKPAFRRRILDKGWIEGTGEREPGASFRPAELYKIKN